MNQVINKKAKVIHFGAGNLFGGIEVMLVTMAKFQGECAELDQEFAFFFEGKVSSQIRSLGFQVKIFPETKIKNLVQVFKTQRLIRKYLEDKKPDALVVHGQWVHFLVAGVAKKLNVKLVHWSHDPPTGKFILDWHVKYCKPDSFICNSLYTKKGCESFIKGVKADVVYCPVENISFQKSSLEISDFRNLWETKKNETVFLHVARWEPHKGHEFLVQGAKKLLESRKDWKVWFVGKPQRPTEENYRRKILNQVVDHGLTDNFRFLGWQEDLALVLSGSDVYCQPNINPEPFGISIVEAMYAGLPVIVTPLGGPGETVQNNCGTHVKPNEPLDLASSMLRFFDQDLRKFLGENGRVRAKEVSEPSSQIRKFYSVISV